MERIWKFKWETVTKEKIKREVAKIRFEENYKIWVKKINYEKIFSFTLPIIL